MDNVVLYVLIVAAVSFGLTMLALIDIIKKDFPTVKEKFIWHMVAVIPIFGWLIYYALGAKKGTRKTF
ncbi:MAG: PLDc N-terminal domain-containing protein [Desulfobacter sp.]